MKSRKKSALSPECQFMINSGYGFRTKSYGGSGVRNALEVIFFECNGMGNYDIPSTMLRLYGGRGDSWQNLRWWVEAGENGDDPLEYIGLGTLYDSFADILENDLPIRVNYALWLGVNDTVKDVYGGVDDDIDAYPIDGAIVLSDLGYDGVLFGFTNRPSPNRTVRNDNIRVYHGTTYGPILDPKSDVNKLPADVGKGFYTTQDYDYAKYMGNLRGISDRSDCYYVTTYDFDDESAEKDL